MGLDSVELLMSFEDAFKHEVPNLSAEKMSTINDAVDYFYTHLQIHHQEECMSQKLFYEFRKYFQQEFNIDKALFTTESKLSEHLPFSGRKEIWKSLEQKTGYKLPSLRKSDFEINTPEDISFLGITLTKRKPPFTDNSVRRFIDCVFSLNYPKLTNLPKVSSRYEIERVIVGITSDKCGIPVEEIETHHSFANDLGID